MISINLIPDVKQELIKAKRVRTVVVSSAITVGIVAVGIVVLLAVYLFGWQTYRSAALDSDIDKKSAQVANVADVEEILTIQSQLTSIDQLHSEKHMTSRFTDLIKSINPIAPDQVTFSTVAVNTDEKMVTIEGQAKNGFVAADIFKKTIEAMKLNYDQDGEAKTELLAKNVNLSNLSYGEDSEGGRVLRFTLGFEYVEQLFAYSAENAVIVRPDRQNATDSFKYVPTSLFSDRAADVGGNQ